MAGCKHCYCEAQPVGGGYQGQCCKCGHRKSARTLDELGDVDWNHHKPRHPETNDPLTRYWKEQEDGG